MDSNLKWECVDAAALLKSKLSNSLGRLFSTGVKSDVENISIELLLEAVTCTFKESSLNAQDHHSNIIGVLYFESESSPSCYVAASAYDKRVLRRGGVGTGDDLVWTVGTPPGIWRVYDEEVNTIVFSQPEEAPCLKKANKQTWIVDGLTGLRWSRPYQDPISGKYIESYVIPLESPTDGTMLGVIIVGSLLVSSQSPLMLNDMSYASTTNRFMSSTRSTNSQTQYGRSQRERSRRTEEVDNVMDEIDQMFEVIDRPKPRVRRPYVPKPREKSSSPKQESDALLHVPSNDVISPLTDESPFSTSTPTDDVVKQGNKPRERSRPKTRSRQVVKRSPSPIASETAALAVKSAGLIRKARQERERLNTLRRLIREDNTNRSGRSHGHTPRQTTYSTDMSSPSSPPESMQVTNGSWIGDAISDQKKTKNWRDDLDEDSSLFGATLALQQCKVSSSDVKFQPSAFEAAWINSPVHGDTSNIPLDMTVASSKRQSENITPNSDHAGSESMSPHENNGHMVPYDDLNDDVDSAHGSSHNSIDTDFYSINPEEEEEEELTLKNSDESNSSSGSLDVNSQSRSYEDRQDQPRREACSPPTLSPNMHPGVRIRRIITRFF